jgi:hypothetical protein
MNNTLTAKEWLEKETEGYLELYDDAKYEISNYTKFVEDFEKYLERYANYRTKELENKIIEFSNQLKTISKGKEYPNILQDIETQCNKHFNIK